MRQAKEEYAFYGWETANIRDGRGLTPRDYYDRLCAVWCAGTCAPRLRERWSPENKTLGQCSITAFLMQDFFGGKVCGIPTERGVHCFNVVGDCLFDLTSEQFGGKKLDYGSCREEFREAHFSKPEKRERYEFLRQKLSELISPVLETERLILRPWSESDAAECYRYAKDPDVGPVAGWPIHKSVEESRQIIRKVLAVPENYAIVLKETGLPVGSIGLHDRDLATKADETELGYWLGKPYWGRGIVPEAAREVLRHAFEDLRFARVWCGYYDGNEKSKRVQEKLGFRYQWTAEDILVSQMNETRKGHVNLLTRKEWQAQRGKERT